MKFSHVLSPLAATALLSSILLAGCAAGGGAKKQESVADRAVARWNYLIDKEPGQAWEYLTPGAREIKSRKAYVAETLVKPVRWSSVEVVDQSCSSEDQCTLKLNVGFKIRSRQTGVGTVAASGPVTETWIRSGGQWYYLPPER